MLLGNGLVWEFLVNTQVHGAKPEMYKSDFKTPHSKGHEQQGQVIAHTTGNICKL